MNPNRRLLLLQVNGINPATFKFQSQPASATDGMTLGAASISGDQGGSVIFTEDIEGIGSLCPVDAVWAYSALGTTVCAEEGTVANFL
jgi:hypothetical protein